eukprot:1104069-Amorphochlora_amoeboformis.AAC.2
MWCPGVSRKVMSSGCDGICDGGCACNGDDDDDCDGCCGCEASRVLDLGFGSPACCLWGCPGFGVSVCESPRIRLKQYVSCVIPPTSFLAILAPRRVSSSVVLP